MDLLFCIASILKFPTEPLHEINRVSVRICNASESANPSRPILSSVVAMTISMPVGRRFSATATAQGPFPSINVCLSKNATFLFQPKLSYF
jgi:hypothetical protein